MSELDRIIQTIQNNSKGNKEWERLRNLGLGGVAGLLAKPVTGYTPEELSNLAQEKFIDPLEELKKRFIDPNIPQGFSLEPDFGRRALGASYQNELGPYGTFKLSTEVGSEGVGNLEATYGGKFGGWNLNARANIPSPEKTKDVSDSLRRINLGFTALYKTGQDTSVYQRTLSNAARNQSR